MNKNAKIYGSIILVLVGLYLLSTFMNISALDDLVIVSVILGGIGVAGKIVKDKKLSNKLKQYSSKGSSGGINYSTDDCKEIAKEWAKNNFHGKINSKKGVSFDWTQSSTEPAPIYNFRDEEWIDVRYFYTPYGSKNQGVFIFIDATNGEHYATKPVKKHEMKENPYNYLESYKHTKRFAGRIRHGDDDGQRVPQITGIPVTQGTVEDGSNGEQ